MNVVGRFARFFFIVSSFVFVANLNASNELRPKPGFSIASREFLKYKQAYSNKVYDLLASKDLNGLKAVFLNLYNLDSQKDMFNHVVSCVVGLLNRDLFEAIDSKDAKRVVAATGFVSLFKNSLGGLPAWKGFSDHALPYSVDLLCQLLFDGTSLSNAEKNKDMENFVKIIVILGNSGISLNSRLELAGDFYKSTSLDILLKQNIESLPLEFQQKYLRLINKLVEMGADFNLKCEFDKLAGGESASFLFSHKSAMEVAESHSGEIYKDIVCIFKSANK